MRSRFLLAAGSILALSLAACGSDESGPSGTDSAGDETDFQVVTSIDVYADLIDQITEGTVEVQPLVASTAIDPHSYEATPQDRLAVENADLLVANGGGYDAFITLLASSAGKDDQVHQLIDGDNEHSHDDQGHYENEHIWYDLERMSVFVEEIAADLGESVPENAELYQDNARNLAEELTALHERATAIGATDHTHLATESVSGFLLDDAGLENLTDPEFLSAVEHGDDVSPRLYQRSLDLAEDTDILSYNSQTETQQSQRIRAAAEDAGAVTLEFTETIPDDASGYLEWMEQNISMVEDAVIESQ